MMRGLKFARYFTVAVLFLSLGSWLRRGLNRVPRPIIPRAISKYSHRRSAEDESH